MKLQAYLLLQALLAFLILSFMMSSIFFSSSYLNHNDLYTQASLQLELYKQSALSIILQALKDQTIIASHIPSTYDASSLNFKQLFHPYNIEFNLLALPKNYICIELYLSITLPDGMFLQKYDSFLIHEQSQKLPKMQCRISLMAD